MICVRGQGTSRPTSRSRSRPGGAASSRTRTCRRSRGTPRSCEVYDPNPITVTWHADFTYAKQPPAISLLLAPHHPAVRRRHDVLERLPRVRGPVRRAPRDARRSPRGPLRDAAGDRQRHARGRDRQLASGGAHAPRDRPAARCSSTATTRGTSTAGRSTTAQPLLDYLYAQFARFEYTWRHRWQEGDLLIWDNRCVQHAVVGDTAGPGALAAPHHDRRRHTDDDRHPLDRQPRRPRRRTARRLDQRLPAKYRDIGPHVVMAPAGHADPRRRRLPRGAGHRRRPDVAWWFYEDQQYSVKRLIAAAGLPAPTRSASTASPSTRCARVLAAAARASTT